MSLLKNMQVSTRNLGVALVPFAADWSDERKVRRRLAGVIDGVSAQPFKLRTEAA